MKNILKSPFAQWLASGLIAVYIYVVRATCRIKIENAHYPNKFWQKDKPIIVSMWHGRLLMVNLLSPPKGTLVALISGHKDGQIIKSALRWFGIKAIQGSSSKGGALAARKMIDQAKAGQSLFITPDGPRGPRMHASDGVLGIARLGDLPILPVTISAQHGKILNTWDRFLLPRPFSVLLVRWGEPITVQSKVDDATRLAIKTTLENSMTKLQQEADRSLSRAGMIHPATPEEKK